MGEARCLGYSRALGPRRSFAATAPLRSATPPLLPQQCLSPAGVVRIEWRLGSRAVVDVVVSPLVVAPIEHGLKIERNVAIILPQGDANGRQPLAEGDAVVF